MIRALVYTVLGSILSSCVVPALFSQDSRGASYEELFMGLTAPFNQRGEAPQPGTTPMETVQALYEDEIFFHLRNSFPKPVIQYLSACFTPGLIEHFDSCNQEIEEWRVSGPDKGPKLNLMEGPVFLSNYESAHDFEIGEARIEEDRAEVSIAFSYSEGGTTFRWIDVVLLQLAGESWLLDDIQFQPERRDDWTLRKRVSIDS